MSTLAKAVIFIVVAIAVIVGARIYSSTFTATKPQEEAAERIMPQEEELRIEDLVLGTGPEAKTGDTVEVHYAGTLTDGTKFDSSYERTTPLTFTIGARQLIEGWERGIVGMKVGGRRRLTIPPSLAYGAEGRGQIPPNATLIFEIELLAIKE
jgi:FKBP-type peptidyl-prolyl cis-trans isomerase